MDAWSVPGTQQAFLPSMRARRTRISCMVLLSTVSYTHLEEVMLFGRDNGHYPPFDLFKAYYAIVDNYTKEIQYISDEIYVTDKYNCLLYTSPS